MSEEFDDLYAEDMAATGDEDGAIEAFCMTCRHKTPIEHPEPIWTRRGAPGTRGTCPECGTTVFRMGWTPAHARLKRPEPVQISETPRGKHSRKAATPVIYINYSVPDAEFAEILAEDLNRIGLPTWLAENAVTDVNWATGVHPSLVECKQMIVILTPLAAKATNVIDAWKFFLQAHKPVLVAELRPTDIPDDLRRKPRFNFSGDDYKQVFRELVQALTG